MNKKNNNNYISINKFLRIYYGVTDENIYEIYGESHNNSWANITVENNKLTVKIMYLENGQPKLWNSYGILKK